MTAGSAADSAGTDLCLGQSSGGMIEGGPSSGERRLRRAPVATRHACWPQAAKAAGDRAYALLTSPYAVPSVFTLRPTMLRFDDAELW